MFSVSNGRDFAVKMKNSWQLMVELPAILFIFLLLILLKESAVQIGGFIL